MTSFDKESYLDSLASEGRLETEQADFTLNEELAVKKLTNLLSDRQKWVLKAVQAGVAGGASGMTFEMGRHHTRVIWRGMKPISAEELLSALSSTKPSQNPFFAELTIGLRALLDTSVFSFKSDGLLKISAERETSVVAEEVCEEAELTVWHPARKGAPSLSTENETTISQKSHLTRDACYAPIPIECDGVLLQQRAWTRMLDDKSTSSSKVFPLFDLKLKTTENWEFCGAPKPSTGFQPDSWKEPPLTQSESEDRASGRFVTWLTPSTGPARFPSELDDLNIVPQKNEVAWLRHGVVGRRDIVKRECATRSILALDAPQSRTGLDGLSLETTDDSLSEARSLFPRFWSDLKPTLTSQLPKSMPLPATVRRERETKVRHSRPVFRIVLLWVLWTPLTLAAAAILAGITALMTGGPSSTAASGVGMICFLAGLAYLLWQTFAILNPKADDADKINFTRLLERISKDMKATEAINT